MDLAWSNPFLKMLMRAKSAGFLIFSLTKDARCKPTTNSYARHVILTPRLLNSFSLPFLPKKSILGNIVLTILFLLTWQRIILEIIPYDDLDTEEWRFFFFWVGGEAALKDKLSRTRSLITSWLGTTFWLKFTDHPWSFRGLPVVSGLVQKCKTVSTK